VEKRKEDVLLATNWVHRLLALKSGEDNPEVVRRLDDLLASIGEAKLGNLYEQEIRALGESCVRPLLSYLESVRSLHNPALRQKAGAILADIAPAWAVKELIQLLADDDRAIRAHAARALERLTGETQGHSPEEWQRVPWREMRSTYDRWQAWWAENADRYEAQTRQTTK
jgi:HEAT repeat protein